MRDYGFTITEHDPELPWIVVASQHRAVTLEDGASFFKWAGENWPRPRWTVELDPYQLARRLRSEAAGPSGARPK
jgi:hypothetical protein